jgi:UDP-N-acetylglucosamine--N-acetylmuramyl-(pentapeptide) pyrophosphoryl-undecaprenol N-acetylglucosamine transferase
VRVLIAGGGTGGHVYPGISVADAFRERDEKNTVLFVGTRKGMESELIPKAGYPLETITVSGFQRKISLQLFKNVLDAVKGLSQAGGIISRFKPDLVIGTGGYVCGPVVAIARLRGIPTMILEQNVVPGVTNRILGRVVHGISVTYEASRSYFPSGKDIRVTGNPIRRDIMNANRVEGRNDLGIASETKLIMSFGGSTGALKINQAMVQAAVHYKENQQVHLLIVTGKDKFQETMDELQNEGFSDHAAGNVTVKPYLYNIRDAYAAADIIVSRAGGISLSELTALGKAAIIVPYPYATNQHQDHNARHLQAAGAAVVIPDRELSGPRLINEIEILLKDPEKLAKIEQNSKELGRPNAAAYIVEWAEDLVRGKSRR